MSKMPEADQKQGSSPVKVCIVAGAGFGSSLGLLFGISFGSTAYIVVGLVCGVVMGLAIGESNRNHKEFRSS
jgi:hypothetical protein